MLSNIKDIQDLQKSNPELLKKIKFWFQNYKGDNVVEFINFESAAKASELIKFTERHFKRSGVRPRG